MKRISLTQGKFAVVNDEDYEYLNIYKWCILKPYRVFYAARAVRVKGKNKFILMHNDILKPNMANTIKRTGIFTSQYKGVHFFKDGKRRKNWKAEITCNGKGKCLGYFHTESEAARAYNIAAKHYFGEFARINTNVVMV